MASESGGSLSPLDSLAWVMHLNMDSGWSDSISNKVNFSEPYHEYIYSSGLSGSSTPICTLLGQSSKTDKRTTAKNLLDYFSVAGLSSSPRGTDVIAWENSTDRHKIDILGSCSVNAYCRTSNYSSRHWAHASNSDEPDWIVPYKGPVPTSYPAFPAHRLCARVDKLMLESTESDQLSEDLIASMGVTIEGVYIPGIEVQFVFSNKTISLHLKGSYKRTSDWVTGGIDNTSSDKSDDPNVPTDNRGYVVTRTGEYLRCCPDYTSSSFYGGPGITIPFRDNLILHGSWGDSSTGEVGTHLTMNGGGLTFDLIDILDCYLNKASYYSQGAYNDPTGIASDTGGHKGWNLEPLYNAVSKPSGKLLTDETVLPSIADVVNGLGEGGNVDLDEMVEVRMRIEHKKWSYDLSDTCYCNGNGTATFTEGASSTSGAKLIKNFYLTAMDMTYYAYAENMVNSHEYTKELVNEFGQLANETGTKYYSMYDTPIYVKYHSYSREMQSGWSNIVDNGRGETYAPYVLLRKKS